MVTFYMNLMGISSFLAFSQYSGQFLAFEGEKRAKNGPKKTHLRGATLFYTDPTGPSSKWKSKIFPNDWAGLKKKNHFLKKKWIFGHFKICQNFEKSSKIIFSLEMLNFSVPHLSPLPKHPIEASFFWGEIKKIKKETFSDFFCSNLALFLTLKAKMCTNYRFS